MPTRAPRCLGLAAIVVRALGRSLEQDVVDDGLVLIGDVGDGRRQREHHMIVWHRQQIGLARGKPVLCRGALALRTVPIAATVVRDLGVRTLLAARDMAAESCCAAVLDCRHHLQLLEADMAGIGSAPCRSTVAEDIRDLQGRARHKRLSVSRAADLLPEQTRGKVP
jgi:hypothetical protein